MSTQKHIQKKPVANIPSARSHNNFARGFSVQTKPDQPSGDLKTQLSRAARFGHNLNQISPVQNKLAIQRQEEPEEEAEQMKSDPTIQRQEEPEEEPEQMKSDPTIQRQEEPEEEPEQMKSEPSGQTSIQRQPNPAATSPGTGNSMPKAVRAQMENSFGTDFSGVNIHTESAQAKSIGALAYTQGNNVHFAPGQYNPDSRSGRSLLGHELTHVVQQRAGRVPVPHQSKGAPINADPALEKEADDMGAKAAQGELVKMPGAGGFSVGGASPVQNSTQPVQCFLPLLMGGLLGGGGPGGLLGGLLGGGGPGGLLGGLLGGGGPGGLLGGVMGGAASGLAGGLAGGGGPGGLLGGVMGGAASGLAGGLAGGGGPGGLLGGVLGGAASGLAGGLLGGDRR
jgi:Domain of unknown function (DUF4157)